MAEGDIPVAPECGLYLRIDPGYDFESLIPHLRDIFFIAKLSKYQRNMHVLELPGVDLAPDGVEEIRGMVGYAQQSGFVAVLRGDAVQARDLGADGVLLDHVDAFAAARAALGAEAIIGLRCGESRNLAETALERGADYVSFHAVLPTALPAPDMAAWWSTRTDIPCLVEGRFSNDSCGAFVGAGVTFIDSSDFVFHHPAGVKQGVADMLLAIDLALENRVAS